MPGSESEEPVGGECVRGFSNLCWGCNHEIDDVCHCGTSYANHWLEEHGFVPYGCVCYLMVAACDPRDRGNCTTESAPSSG